MVVGVNGTGKTTTIGKFAHNLKAEGHEVTLVAADTFRAAAMEQLEIWAKRADVHHPAGRQIRSHRRRLRRDPRCQSRPTARRRHRRHRRTPPYEGEPDGGAQEDEADHGAGTSRGAARGSFVLDATTGQNAIAQARMFRDEIGVTGLILTKLDGTSEGGRRDPDRKGA